MYLREDSSMDNVEPFKSSVGNFEPFHKYKPIGALLGRDYVLTRMVLQII